MEELLEAIQLGATKILELKERLPHYDQIAKTIIAFSNTSGGRLVLGVDNDRKIVGVHDDEVFELQDAIASIIYDRCAPNIIPEIYTQHIQGKTLLVVEVFRGNLLPYYLKAEGKHHGTYIRIGATNRKAGYDNILELERQRRHSSYDEEINYEVDFARVDIANLTRKFQDIGKPLDEEKLRNLGLIGAERGQLFPTNGLLILLGLFAHCCIKCGRFRGKTMEVFLDQKEYRGDLFTQLEQAEHFILNYISVRGEIKGLQRTDTYEIPLEAIREALLNALVHRDYINTGRDIKIGVYDDVVNIVSPGGFPNTLTEKEVLAGRSELRNKVVARVLKELKYIEQWGSGVQRMLSSCARQGLRTPRIRETGDFVDVELYREHVERN